MAGEEFGVQHMSHELWHDLKPFLAGGIAAIFGAIVLVCRKRIRGWFK